MATAAYKVLGQQAPSGTSETTLYTVPGGTTAIVATVSVCNYSGSQANATVRVKVAGAAAANKQLLMAAVPISPGRTETLTLGIGLAATDVISVTAGTGSALAFQAFGVEIA